MKKIIYQSLLVMMFSFTMVYASEADFFVEKQVQKEGVENGVKDLTLGNAIIQAQKADKKLKAQKTNIELAKANAEAAKDYYYNQAWEVGYEQASANYEKAMANKEYQIKNESLMEEQIGFDIANRFDDILELEENHKLLLETIKIQKQKITHAIRREFLGLGSKIQVQAEEAKLALQNKELASLVQAINTEYRKLNDAIDGEEERYKLIKDNTYEPLDMEKSLDGQISHAINSDLGLWLQEEIAKTAERTFTAPERPGSGAPTYALYQQRKLGFEQSMNDISLNKESKKEQIKQIYENIQALEIQYDKTLMDLAENQRQYRIMEQRYALGMITPIVLDELQLAILQNEMKLSSTIRQHNQLKVLFEKSYLGVPKM